MANDQKRPDYVKEYIELYQKKDEIEERMDALKTIILNDKESQKDKRVTIVDGREKIVLNDSAYEKLEMIGEETEVTKKKKKQFKDFSEEIQKFIKSDPKNYKIKKYSGSVRLNKENIKKG